MKKSFLFISPLLILLFTGCASIKNGDDGTKIHIIEATYHNWTEKLPNSSLPESGTDLQLTLKDWPTNFVPVHIIFRGYKSNSAALTDSAGENIMIQARIIRTSDVLAMTSEKAEYTDRLVYTTAKGDTAFLEIEKWQTVKK